MRTTGGWLASSKGFTHQSRRAAKSAWNAGRQRYTEDIRGSGSALRVDVRVGDVGQLVALAPEPTAPTAEPGVIGVGQPVGDQGEERRRVPLLDPPHWTQRPRPDVTATVVGVEVAKRPVAVDVRLDPFRRDQARIAAPVHPPVRPPLRDHEQPWELLSDPRTRRVLVADGVDTQPCDEAAEFLGRPVPANPPESLGKVGGTSPDHHPDRAGIRSVHDPDDPVRGFGVLALTDRRRRPEPSARRPPAPP